MRFYRSNNHPAEYAFHLYDNFVVTLCVIVRSRRYLPVLFTFIHRNFYKYISETYNFKTLRCYKTVLLSYVLYVFIYKYKILVQYTIHNTHAYRE